MIQQVMEHIVRQTIPQVVVNNPTVDWNPRTNEVKPAAEKDSDSPAPAGLPVSNAPEPNTRYAMLLEAFAAEKRRTLIRRRLPHSLRGVLTKTARFRKSASKHV